MADPNASTDPLPPVRLWLVWTEPGNPIFLTPQYKRVGKGQGASLGRPEPDRLRAHVHRRLHRRPRDAPAQREGRLRRHRAARHRNPLSARTSIGPLPFLRGVKKAGLKTFDAWAHHPYYARPTETPASKPTSNRGKRGRIAPPVVLGNIQELIDDVTRLYGRKRIWITEYGYQTNAADWTFGVTYAKQAAYMRQAYAIARKNPRIDMMVWFLLKDEQRLGGWQSGLLSAAGKKKPAFNVFRALPR